MRIAVPDNLPGGREIVKENAEKNEPSFLLQSGLSTQY
jgi:hypothetical protein